LIRYSQASGIARITLHRPEKRNALSPEMIASLRAVLEQSAEDDAIRVVLLTAAEPDFCAGLDLSGLHASAENVLDHIGAARELAEIFLAIRRHPRPVVAAVRGRALGGGCGLATGSDLIVASDSAKFGYPEVNIGFVPAMVMAILRRSVSDKRAFELLATGEVISAAEAHAIGMINRVFPDAEFESNVEKYVANLASKSASSLSLTKNLLYHTDGMTFEAALEAGIHTNALARMTEDARRGFERFTKKRE